MSIGTKSKKSVKAVRTIVMERDGNECIVRGSGWDIRYPCQGILTIQHAVGRGMGGSNRYDKAPYLRAMCWLHNGLAESNADFAQACRDNGWAIPRWAVESTPIELLPVKYPDGWCLLQGENRVNIDEDTAKELQAEIYG